MNFDVCQKFALKTYKNTIIIITYKTLIFTGEFWIDPNGGHTEDKVKVECNFVSDRVETCIQAITEFDIMKMEEFKQDFTQHKWMSTLTETTKVRRTGV